MTPKPPVRFTVGADEFRHGVLSAADEFHCVRRVAPVVQRSDALLSSIATLEDYETSVERIAGMIRGSAPLIHAFAELSEEGSNYVIARCLGVTEMRDGETWVPTWDPEAQAPALPGLRMIHILRICYAVLADAMTVFFSETLSSLIELKLLRLTTPPFGSPTTSTG